MHFTMIFFPVAILEYVKWTEISEFFTVPVNLPKYLPNAKLQVWQTDIKKRLKFIT